MTNRLFVAQLLPEEVISELISIRNAIYKGPLPGRWEGTDKLHLTLKFLGDTEETKTDAVIKALEKNISKTGPISCEFERFGFFLPRILWLGLRVGEELFNLVKGINNDMELLGFEKEIRNFKPHITLLRIKSNPSSDFVSAFKDYKLPARKFQSNEIALMRSKLLPGGSVYSEIKRFYLT